MSGAASPLDYLVVGHVTRDLLPGGGHTLGGTAAYAALTVHALGGRAGILTSAGEDEDLTALESTLPVVRHPAPATTTFENRYVDGRREQLLYALAHPLTPAALPPAWATTPVVHLGPVMGECAPELIAAFPAGTFVGLTPQGWMRAADAQGRVHPAVWSHAERVLPLAAAVVMSIEDLGGDWARAERLAELAPLLVVTCGREGGRLFAAGRAHRFPALSVAELDATGAGDVFAAAFFLHMASGHDPITAAHVAGCLASHSVTRRGLASAPRAEEVAACSAILTRGTQPET